MRAAMNGKKRAGCGDVPGFRPKADCLARPIAFGFCSVIKGGRKYLPALSFPRPCRTV